MEILAPPGKPISLSAHLSQRCYSPHHCSISKKAAGDLCQNPLGTEGAVLQAICSAPRSLSSQGRSALWRGEHNAEASCKDSTRSKLCFTAPSLAAASVLGAGVSCSDPAPCLVFALGTAQKRSTALLNGCQPPSGCYACRKQFGRQEKK